MRKDRQETHNLPRGVRPLAGARHRLLAHKTGHITRIAVDAFPEDPGYCVVLALEVNGEAHRAIRLNAPQARLVAAAFLEAAALAAPFAPLAREAIAPDAADREGDDDEVLIDRPSRGGR